MLLSFAQFEREITGERIRDKIAASKQKGLWMGCNVPLGYDASERTLVINPAEAETVRCIFVLYLELGCVRRVKRPTASGSGRNAARRRMAPSAAADPSRAVISTHCCQTRSTPVTLPTRVRSTPSSIRR